MAKSLLVVSLFILAGATHAFSIENSNDLPALADGLSWTFYNESCPNVEIIVNETLESLLDGNITEAPGLLRLLFHDCFVQGCDASILLNGTGSELEDALNLSLREQALEMIGVIKEAVEAECPDVVSCADVLALAGSYSVYMAGGPEFPVPLGRRDSLTFANESVTEDNLPDPAYNLSELVDLFTEKGFSELEELVALSGELNAGGIVHSPGGIHHLMGIGNHTMFVYRGFNNHTNLR